VDCKVVHVPQQSDEWFALRRCRITASRLGDVMAGKKTDRYRRYRREKVLELLGHEAVEENPEWFAHGREQEPRAIAAYEWKFNVDTEHDVFMISDKYDWLGASPDMLHIAADSNPDNDDEYNDGAEIKCRKLYKNYRLHIQMAKQFEGSIKAAAAANRHQIQGNIMISGFDRWGLVNYYEGKGPNGEPKRLIHRVWIPRDEKLISDMEVRSLELMKEVYEIAGLDK